MFHQSTDDLGADTTRTWTPMQLTLVGHIAQILHGGGGKLSVPTADTGDAPRKPSGHG